jgi:hypothetical protein
MICTYDDWKVEIKTHSIVVEKFGQQMEYDIPQWRDVEQNNEYIYITLPDESMLQFKMEFDNFFVGDEFDRNGEFLDTIANYVFEEELEEDFD